MSTLAQSNSNFFYATRCAFESRFKHSKKSLLLELETAIKFSDSIKIQVYTKSAPSIVLAHCSSLLDCAENAKSLVAANALGNGLLKSGIPIFEIIRNEIVRDYYYTVLGLLEADMLPEKSLYDLVIHAVNNGSMNSLKALCNTSNKLNNIIKYSSFEHFIRSGHTDFAKSLIDNDHTFLDTDVDSFLNEYNFVVRISSTSFNPLCIAAANNQNELVELILNKQGITKQKSLDIALRIAILRENYTNYIMLRDAGGDINSNNGQALTDAIRDDEAYDRQIFLIREGAEIMDHHIDRLDSLTSFVKPFISGNNPSRTLKPHLPKHLPYKLKSDAFSSSLPWTKQPFVSVLLDAAHVASVFAIKSADRRLKFFNKIIESDIQRVENTKGLGWKRYMESISNQSLSISNFSDVLQEVGDVLIFPILMSIDNVTNVGPVDILQKISKNIAADFLIDDKSTLDIVILNAKWHKAGCRCPDELRPYSLIDEWQPLFKEPVDIGDKYRVVCLHTPAQLKDEGNAMLHCVGGYSGSCRNGRFQILSIRDQVTGMSKATISLAQNKDGEIAFKDGTKWALSEIKSTRNSEPEPSVINAFEEFKFMVKEGLIKENSELRKIDASQRLSYNSALEARNVMGFDLSEASDVREKLLKHYYDRVFVERSGARVTLFSESSQNLLLDWVNQPKEEFEKWWNQNESILNFTRYSMIDQFN